MLKYNKLSKKLTKEDNHMKRILSLVLCLSMLLSVIPANVFATDTEQDPTPTEAILIPETTEEIPSETTEEVPTEATVSPETTVPEEVPAQETTQPSLPEETLPPEETISQEEPQAYTASSFTWVPGEALPDSDALFAGYAMQQFYGTGKAARGTAAGATLDKNHKKIYDALASQIRLIAAGQLDSAVIAVGQELGDVTVQLQDSQTGTVTTCVVPCYPAEEIVIESADLDLQKLLSVLLADFPYDLYWFDKTAGISALPISGGSGKICIVFYFSVSEDYNVYSGYGRFDTKNYILNTQLTGAAANAASYAQTVVNQHAGAGDYAKLTAYRDTVIDLASYNHSAASGSYSYGDPWQLIWVFDQDPTTTVVCEGYSKAFQYLCDLTDFANDIVCYNVVGMLNPRSSNRAPHMWNVVAINGSSYLADLTNCDSGFSLFLRGGKADAVGLYTFDGVQFEYDSEATDLWGSGSGSVLTLASSNFDPDSLNQTPDPTPPETEPEEDVITTGEELAAAMNACTDSEYTLNDTITVDSAVLLPAAPALIISEHGSITVNEGGSLTMEAGGKLTNRGLICVQDGGTLDLRSSTYLSEGGQVQSTSTCDSVGTARKSIVLGIGLDHMTLLVETYSDDQIVRDMIAYADSLMTADSTPSFQIRFLGRTTVSRDLELPSYCDCVVPAGGTLTVPAGVTLTDHSGMIVYGTLDAEGTVIAVGSPLMIGSTGTLLHPENCSNYYIQGLALESITLGTDATVVPAGSAVQLWIEAWEPIAAEYFGHYTISVSENAECYRNELGNPVISCSDPGIVTVTVTATDPLGQPLSSGSGQPVSQTLTLTFASDRITLFPMEDTADFLEEGFPGFYPGSSLHLYGSLTGNPAEIDQTLLWTYPELPENVAVITQDAGVLTVTVSESLTEAQSIVLTAGVPGGIVADASFELRLRPRAIAADIVLNGETVTDQTILFDMNRGTDSLQLLPVTTPANAYIAEGLSADGKTPLVQWKSSSTSIATVENGLVAFTGKTGKVTITMTANFGSKTTASVTFQVVALAQEILPGEGNPGTLIGGSSASFTVTDETGTTLKSSAVKWFLCDQTGEAIDAHPYASITAAGKLTTKAVADETEVYLMAQAAGDEYAASLNEPILVTLYPAVSSVQILDAQNTVVTGKTLLHHTIDGETCRLYWDAAPYPESVQSIGWKSSSTKVAVIDNESLIQILKPGTAKFTLTVTALNGKKTTATVTMKFGILTEDLLLSAAMPDGSISQTMNDLTIFGGQSITFQAENLPADVTTAGVNWSLDSKTYASISSKGVLKAKTVTNPVTVTVLAESKDGACIRKIPVTILPKEGTLVISAAVSGDTQYLTKTTVTLEMGKTLQLSAGETVTWTSSKPGVTTVDTDTGFLEALSAGTAKITATAADGSKRKAEFTLKVTQPFDLVSITTKKGEPFTVASGKSLTLVGTVHYADGSSNTKVNWSVDDTELATISSSGKLTAAKNLTASAVVHVTATAKEGQWSVTQPVQLVPVTTALEIYGPFGKGTITDVTNTTRKWDMATQGTALSLSVKTFPSGAMGASWKSSSTKIATVDQNGNVICLKAGTVTITATAADGSGKKATFKLTVQKTMAPDSLQLPETAFIGGGKSLTMTSLSGYRIDSEATNKTLSWSVTFETGAPVPSSVASVSGKGVLKTKAVTTPVRLYVTAAATDGSGETARCLVTVYPVTKGITLYAADGKTAIPKSTISLPVAQIYTVLPDTTNAKGYGLADDLTADEYLPNGAAWTVTFSKQNVAAVKFDGQAMIVSAIGNPVGQSVKITLKANDGSGKSASFTVKFT